MSVCSRRVTSSGSREPKRTETPGLTGRAAAWMRRPTTAGGHYAIEETIRAQFGPVLRAFGGLRRRRNELEYPLYPTERANAAKPVVPGGWSRGNDGVISSATGETVTDLAYAALNRSLKMYRQDSRTSSPRASGSARRISTAINFAAFGGNVLITVVASLIGQAPNSPWTTPRVRGR